MELRMDYPRPQFVRESWTNLNGTWQFAFDDGDQGWEQNWQAPQYALPMTIEVPFVYQSKASGIGDRTHHDLVWYKREFSAQKKENTCLWLHFGAVDYETWVYINGQLAAHHVGGHTSFSVEISAYLQSGPQQQLCLRVRDPQKDELIPRGKQSWEDHSTAIWYTGSTGIWQTVWMEETAKSYISQVRFTTLFEQGEVKICCDGQDVSPEDRLEYEISFQGNTVARGALHWEVSRLEWCVDVIQNHIFRTSFHNGGWCWSPEYPNLFDVQLQLVKKDGTVSDQVESYFGFRKVHTENGMVYLNNKPYYQKLVLDQGYWPDTLLTAPDGQALLADIQAAKEMGFNGCRKHQKTEDPRFLYFADKLGYLVWGECAAPAMYSGEAASRLMQEWTEIIQRDYNHPCIITWVPINESWGVPHIHLDRVQQHFSQAMYHYLHALDDTRLVISNDGWEMTQTDVCAIHNYMHGQKDEVGKYQNYCKTLSTVEDLVSRPSAGWRIYAKGFSHQGAPVLLTEFGGIAYDVSGEKGWGYTSVEDAQAFVEDYARIMDAVYASDGLWGFCYTQLTDVEQEINGLLTYDRKPKCDPAAIRAINEGYHRSSL